MLEKKMVSPGFSPACVKTCSSACLFERSVSAGRSRTRTHKNKHTEWRGKQRAQRPHSHTTRKDCGEVWVCLFVLWNINSMKQSENNIYRIQRFVLAHVAPSLHSPAHSTTPLSFVTPGWTNGEGCGFANINWHIWNSKPLIPGMRQVHFPKYSLYSFTYSDFPGFPWPNPAWWSVIWRSRGTFRPTLLTFFSFSKKQLLPYSYLSKVMLQTCVPVARFRATLELMETSFFYIISY